LRGREQAARPKSKRAELSPRPCARLQPAGPSRFRRGRGPDRVRRRRSKSCSRQ
jgi:hypothetical protein